MTRMLNQLEVISAILKNAEAILSDDREESMKGTLKAYEDAKKKAPNSEETENGATQQQSDESP